MQKITLTDIDIERCSHGQGAYKYEVIRLLGGMGRSDVHPMEGWKRRLCGTVISREIYEQALAVSRLPKLRNVPNGEARGQLSLL